MAELYYPRLKVNSCDKCEVGIVEAYRRDGLPGSHLFRCPCTRPVGKSGRYPTWNEKFAANFITKKEKRRAG
jgi:hypothetical protein